MLLQLIFITFVICTAEISEFHAFFLCFFAHFGNFSLVSFRAFDKFSLSSVVVSLSMSQTRGSCGHLKGNYDNHSSCLNCTGCFRSSCCSVCLLWPDLTWSLVSKRRRFSDRRKMGKRRRKRRKQRKGRIPPLGILPVQDPVLNRLLCKRTHPGLPPTVMMMTTHQFCLCHHRGVSGDTGLPGSRSSHRTPGLSPKGRLAHRSTPARFHPGDLAGKYGVQALAMDFEATLLDLNPTPGDSNQVTLSKDR